MSEERTWLVSVLFLDIVGYSRVPVDQQLKTKVHFNAAVVNSIEELDDDECIHLDTGDGCAICYLGDPEKIYSVALSLKSAFANLLPDDELYYQVRLGLNLGPVKILKDLKGEKNCVGAGINDAQRIMDFATGNQLLVSKSYFDVVINMSSKYGEELVPAGSRADKHDKVHEIYELAGEHREPEQPRVRSGGFDLDDQARERIQKEYAKYVGKDEANARIESACSVSSSVTEVCQQLADALSEDDRYHFREYTRYYGYT